MPLSFLISFVPGSRSWLSGGLVPRWEPGSLESDHSRTRGVDTEPGGDCWDGSCGFVCKCFFLASNAWPSWIRTFHFPFKHTSSHIDDTHSLSNLSVTPGAADSLQAMSSVVTVVACYFSLQQLCICSGEKGKHGGACSLGSFDGKCAIDRDRPMTITFFRPGGSL